MNGPWPIALAGGAVIGLIVCVLIGFERLAKLADDRAGKRAARKAEAEARTVPEVADFGERRRQRNAARRSVSGRGA